MSEPGERRRRREMERAAAETAATPETAAGAAAATPQWASSWPPPTRPEAVTGPEEQPRSDPRPPTASRRALRERPAADERGSSGTPGWAAPRPAPDAPSRPSTGTPDSSATGGRSTLGPVPRNAVAPGRVPPPVPAQAPHVPAPAPTPAPGSPQGGVRPPTISDTAYRSRRATRDTLDPTADRAPGPDAAVRGGGVEGPNGTVAPGRAGSNAAPEPRPGGWQPRSAEPRPAAWGGGAVAPSPVRPERGPAPAASRGGALPAQDGSARTDAATTGSSAGGRSGSPTWAPGGAAATAAPTPRPNAAPRPSAPAWAPDGPTTPAGRPTSPQSPEQASAAWPSFGGGPASQAAPSAWTSAPGDVAPTAVQTPAPPIPTPASEPRRGSWAVTEPEPVAAAPLPPAPGRPHPEREAPVAAFPSPRTAPPGEPYEEDDEPVAHRHPYTWLHLIVLAVVAFVLGFLVVALWNHGRQGGTPGAAGSSVVVVAAQAAAVADPTTAS